MRSAETLEMGLSKREWKVLGWVLLALVLAGGFAWGQAPAKPAAAPAVQVPVVPVTPAAPVVACDAVKTDASGFTECQQLRLQGYQLAMSNLQYQMNELQNQARQMQQQQGAFVQQVVAGSGGRTYEAPSQQFPVGRLVAPPSAAAKSAGK